MNAVDAVFEQLENGSFNPLRQVLKRSYSTVHMPCPVALTCVSVVATTGVRWKGDENADDRESRRAEGCSSKTC